VDTKVSNTLSQKQNAKKRGLWEDWELEALGSIPSTTEKRKKSTK
jgi:hypothetical protein